MEYNKYTKQPYRLELNALNN